MVSSVENNPHSSSIANVHAGPARHPVRPGEQVLAGSADRVSLSKNARQLFSMHGREGSAESNGTELSPEEEKEVENLKKKDQEVKAHERAHMAAGADLIFGGANYQYETGPDGRMYAVSGEVKIDTSKERDPRATISKMQRVRRAALAPAQPSATDKKVAAEASQIEAQARSEAVKEKRAQEEEETDKHEPALDTGLFQTQRNGDMIDISV